MKANKANCHAPEMRQICKMDDSQSTTDGFVFGARLSENMKLNTDDIKVLAFDADDTLWDNQSYYDRAEEVLKEELAAYLPADEVSSALFGIETANMKTLGYGAKAFTISLMETALKVSGGKISGEALNRILNAGKSVLQMACTPFENVSETLAKLRARGKYKLVMFTKGELLDQQNKIERSGLGKYFSHIEIVSNKSEKEYIELCRKLQIKENEFLMVGNSFKSDIAPVLTIGGYGIHIPFERTWQHEIIEEYDHDRLVRISKFSEIPDYLK